MNMRYNISQIETTIITCKKYICCVLDYHFFIFFKTLIDELNIQDGYNVAIGGTFYSEDFDIYPNNASKEIYHQINNLTSNEDLIIIWAGTNDFDNSHKLGTMLNEQGKLNVEVTTFYGGVNKTISDLHNKFGKDIPIIICSLSHSNMKQGTDLGYPYSSKDPNKLGLYLSSYIDSLKELSTYYNLSFFDSDKLTSLNPNLGDIYNQYYTNWLHPNNIKPNMIGKTLVQFIKDSELLMLWTLRKNFL